MGSPFGFGHPPRDDASTIRVGVAAAASKLFSSVWTLTDSKPRRATSYWSETRRTDVCNLPFFNFQKRAPPEPESSQPCPNRPEGLTRSLTEEAYLTKDTRPRFGKPPSKPRLLSGFLDDLPLTFRHLTREPSQGGSNSTGPPETDGSCPASFSTKKAFLHPTTVFTEVSRLCGQPRGWILQTFRFASTISRTSNPDFHRRGVKTPRPVACPRRCGRTAFPSWFKELHILSTLDQAPELRIP